MSQDIKPKVIVILGPTATGKSDMAVKVAKKFNGEIISADSRQVFRGMDLGSGKITKKEMMGVRHHLLDILSPNTIFSMAKYKSLAEKAIEDILDRNKTPIICGGTGYYIQSVVENFIIPDVKQDPKLRKELDKLSTQKLFVMLKKLDKNRAETIDKNNRVRLVRAIEIAKTLKSVPPLTRGENKYNFIQIGLRLDKTALKEKIHVRLIKRIKKGMIKEIENLHKDGVSWKRLESFGLEYRNVAEFLQGKVSRDEMINNLENKIVQFAKRQVTWFKRHKNIKWFEPKDFELIEQYLHENFV